MTHPQPHKEGECQCWSRHAACRRC